MTKKAKTQKIIITVSDDDGGVILNVKCVPTLETKDDSDVGLAALEIIKVLSNMGDLDSINGRKV